MAKKMLFNVNEPEEIRCAILSDGSLCEYDVETQLREKNKNNIYRGVIVKLEPSIQAVFVDYGVGRHGFLPFRNIHPDFWTKNLHLKNEKRRIRVDEVLERNQTIVVQVEREEVEQKGAMLTTYCTLPGRYLVLRPKDPGINISSKITRSSDRKALLNILKELNPPKDLGFIIRTAGLGKSKDDIAKDYNYLLRMWENIQKEIQRDSRVGLLFKDGDLIMRMIRDYFDSDVEEILVDEEKAYQRARSYFSIVMPEHESIVKFYEGRRPLFSLYDAESQIADVYARKLPLPSGGSICIDVTEALIAIDVNSGSTQSEEGIEETALKTNIEAAHEIARQLRLRDLGGLIVIDFISMRILRNVRRVEQEMYKLLKADKAQIKMGRISSSFGLLSLSRQRIRDAKDLAHFIHCPSCHGVGRIPSPEADAFNVLRTLKDAAARNLYAKVEASLPKEVAFYLLNEKRGDLLELEEEFDVNISINIRDGLSVDFDNDFKYFNRTKYSISRRKRQRIRSQFVKASNQLKLDSETPSKDRGKEQLPDVQLRPSKAVLQREEKTISSDPFAGKAPFVSGASKRTQDTSKTTVAPSAQKVPSKETPAPIRFDSPLPSPSVLREYSHLSSQLPDGFPWFLRNLKLTQPVALPFVPARNSLESQEQSAENTPQLLSKNVPNSPPRQKEKKETPQIQPSNTHEAHLPRISSTQRRHSGKGDLKESISAQQEERTSTSFSEKQNPPSPSHKKIEKREETSIPSQKREEKLPDKKSPQKTNTSLQESSSQTPKNEVVSSLPSFRVSPKKAKKLPPRKQRRELRREIRTAKPQHRDLKNPKLHKRHEEDFSKRDLDREELEYFEGDASTSLFEPTEEELNVDLTALQKEELKQKLSLPPIFSQMLDEKKSSEKSSTKQATPAKTSMEPVSAKSSEEPKKNLEESKKKEPLWSVEELQRIRQAEEDEARRVARWDRNVSKSLGVSSFIVPPKKETSEEATAFEHESLAEAQHRRRIVTPDPQKMKKQETKTRKTKARRRWTKEELAAVKDVLALAIDEAYSAFLAKGFQRSFAAFRNKFYALE